MLSESVWNRFNVNFFILFFLPPRRLEVFKGLKVDSVLRNFTVFEYPENKVSCISTFDICMWGDVFCSYNVFELRLKITFFANVFPLKKINWRIWWTWWSVSAVSFCPSVLQWLTGWWTLEWSWIYLCIFGPCPLRVELKLFAQMSGRAYRATECFWVISTHSLTHSFIHSLTHSGRRKLFLTFTQHLLSYVFAAH